MVNPAFWQNVNEVENFGFLSTFSLPVVFLCHINPRGTGTQVQPFNLTTPDGETIYAWHMLPIHLCREHEELLNANEPSGPAEDVTQTAAFKLLAEDPNARVVVSCKFPRPRRTLLPSDHLSPRKCRTSRL